MGGWDHGPSTAVDEQTAETSARNARYGLWLFALYCATYALFVLLNAFSPDSMTTKPVAGVTLSVLYGLGLILLAFVLSLIYSWLCRANVAPAGKAAASDRQEGSR